MAAATTRTRTHAEAEAEAGRLRLALGLTLGAAAVLLLVRARRRFATVQDVPASYFERRRYLHGHVVEVGDGDGFRLVHTPLLAWFGGPPAAHRTCGTKRGPT
jgi:hypothetical protein